MGVGLGSCIENPNVHCPLPLVLLACRVLPTFPHEFLTHSLTPPIHPPTHYCVFQESREGDSFEVPVKVARLSTMIDEMFDEDDDMEDKKVPLPNVSSEVLRKVIEFGKHYQEEQMTPIQTPLKSSNIDDLVQKWYAEFVDLPQKQLFELVA